MIFPWLNGIGSFYRSPLTWGLLLLNAFLFLGFQGRMNSDLFEKAFRNPGFLKVQAYLYTQYLEKNPSPDTDEMLVALEKNKSNQQDILWLVQASFRDSQFIEEIENLNEFPDPILHGEWKETFDMFQSKQKNYNLLTRFGISSFSKTWSSYFTYQFIHSGWLHLISNMAVLLIFGTAVEILYGPAILGILYLVGGAVGALVYTWTMGISFSPLVGASGSVSALMGFYLIAEVRRNVPFFYFLSPMPGHSGVIYLSKWWVLLTAVVNDLGSILSTPNWLMGVAYTAHLGSSLFGIIVALILVLVIGSKMGAQAIRRAQIQFFSFQSEQIHDA